MTLDVQRKAFGLCLRSHHRGDFLDDDPQQVVAVALDRVDTLPAFGCRQAVAAETFEPSTLAKADKCSARKDR